MRDNRNINPIAAETSSPWEAAPLPPESPAADGLVRVRQTDHLLLGLSSDDFSFANGRAALVIAFVSPHVDFGAVTFRLKQLAGKAPVVAVTTAGELCSTAPGDGLYRPTGKTWSSVVVQIFSSELISKVSIHAVPLPNEDIRRGAPSLPWDERVKYIARSLNAVHPRFPLNVKDCFALTFIDGRSSCEGHFMEAIYASARFPVLFVGASAGSAIDSQRTFIFTDTFIMENHAVIVFVKLAPSKYYGVLKSHNFRRTGASFVVVDADPDRRTVALVEDRATGQILPLVDSLCRLLNVAPQDLASRLSTYSFGIELDSELYLRSFSGIDLEKKVMSFFCDVSPGDELLLLKATDFVQQTKRDVEDFLKGKPQPIAAILNDCIKRRINNESRLEALSSLWPVPVAGFSSFSEILGINLNQTLTALVFFDEGDAEFRDDFIDNFPIIYAGFAQVRQRRLANLNRLLAHIAEQVNKMTVDDKPLQSLPGNFTGEIGALNTAFFRLIQKLTESREKMARMARHDSLTGLPNRSYFFERARQELTRAHRLETRIALLFLDLDGFKPVNDELGHEAGDMALIEVSRRLSSIIREVDTLARLGGDEFVILLSDLDPDPLHAQKSACTVAEKCIAAIDEPFSIENRIRHLGLSIGVVTGDGQNKIEQLIIEADQAMYQAKKNGKGRYVIARPAGKEETRR